MVHARYRDEYSFEKLRDEYEAMPKEPLLVRGMLGTPYIPAEPDGSLHLDGILAYQVLKTHLRAPILPRTREDDEVIPAILPLPLELAWTGDYGERDVVYSAWSRHMKKTEILASGNISMRPPLWVCSDLRPQGDSIRSQEYWHKRYPESRHDEVKKSKLPNARSGRWKEYRVPISTIHVPEIRAICIGNAAEIMRLLSEVSHVGKKAGMGYGRVLQWKASRLEQDIETTREAALRARPIPVEYLMDAEGEMTLRAGDNYSRRGWSCPYWFAPLWSLAVIRE